MPSAPVVNSDMKHDAIVVVPQLHFSKANGGGGFDGTAKTGCNVTADRKYAFNRDSKKQNISFFPTYLFPLFEMTHSLK